MTDVGKPDARDARLRRGLSEAGDPVPPPLERYLRLAAAVDAMERELAARRSLAEPTTAAANRPTLPDSEARH